MKIRCLLGHDWPEIWSKYGERSLIDVDGVWFEVFEKVCKRCKARKTYDGPLRYSKISGGDIMR